MRLLSKKSWRGTYYVMLVCLFLILSWNKVQFTIDTQTLIDTSSDTGVCSTFTPQFELQSFERYKQWRKTLNTKHADKLQSGIQHMCPQDKSKLARKNITSIKGKENDDHEFFHEGLLKHSCCNYFDTNTIVEAFMCRKIYDKKKHPLEYKIDYKTESDVKSGTKCMLLLIQMNETQKGEFLQGGSSFRVQVQHKQTGAVSLCSVQDYFNGSYRIVCPLYTGCNNVTVIRVYSDFFGFLLPEAEYKYYGENKEVWKQDVCPEHAQKPTMPGWRLKGDNWHYYPEVFYNGARIEKCLSQLNSVTFLGSSHLRFMADYILIALGQTTMSRGGIIPDKAKYQAEVRYKNFHYILTRLTYEITARLFGMLNKEKTIKTKRDVVVMMGGSHDMQSRSLEYYINEAVPRVSGILKKMKRMPQWRKARMIWVNNIAHPEMMCSPRNNVNIQASNAPIER